MTGSPVPAIRAKLDRFKERLSGLEARREFIRSQRRAAELRAAELKYLADLNQKSSEIFKSWLEDLLDNNVNSMAGLVTAGLRHVIDDQEITFKIVQELKYNRLSMRFAIEEDGVEGDPMSSFGGGAVLFASFVLRMAVISRMKMGNLLLLDESMSALANRYVPAAADFMRRLSEETGVNILMVTHNDEFMANAHTSYEGFTVRDSGGGSKALRLRRRA
jgi:DNA repair exonuclease SbcCD ATPase subunit